MVQTVTIPGVGDLDFPDDMTQEEMAAAIQKNFPQIHRQDPVQANTTPVADIQQENTGVDLPGSSILSALGPGGVMGPGVVEPILQAGSGMVNLFNQGVGAIGGGVTEFAKQTFNDDPYNKEKIVSAADAGLKGAPQIPQYEPMTKQGIEGSKNLAGVMASPLNPLNYGRQLNEYLGGSDKLAEAGQPALATGLEIGADLLSGYGVGKVVQKGVQGVQASQATNNLQREEMARRIIERTGDKDLAPVTIERPAPGVTLTPENAKIRKDVEAISATKQGFDDGVLAAIKATSEVNKQKLLRMTEIKQRSKENSTYGATNRPSDVVGDSLAEIIRYVKTVNKKAGSELDGVASTLRGQPIDASIPVNKLRSDLEAAGVKFDSAGNPKYKGSDFEGDGASQKILNLVFERSKSPNMGDAFYAHRVKRFIDNKTSYGVNKAGATGDAQRIIKDFRRNVDQRLDEAFPEYNKVNTTYSDTVNALDSFKDAAGGKVNLFGENADKALGTVSRRLLSNAQSRVNLMDSIKSLETVSKKYGADFKDDIMTQVMFADELDKVFGASAKTSLLGDVEKGTRTALETAAGQRTMTSLAIDGAAKAAQRARGINENNAFKSIKELLSRSDDHIGAAP